jgi:hypothetical protein
MRSVLSERKIGSLFVTEDLVSAAWVALEHRGFAVTNLAHDLHCPLAIGAERHFGARHERNDPQSPLAATALG